LIYRYFQKWIEIPSERNNNFLLRLIWYLETTKISLKDQVQKKRGMLNCSEFGFQLIKRNTEAVMQKTTTFLELSFEKVKISNCISKSFSCIQT